jgi:hypothetical protein
MVRQNWWAKHSFASKPRAAWLYAEKVQAWLAHSKLSQVTPLDEPKLFSPATSRSTPTAPPWGSHPLLFIC